MTDPHINVLEKNKKDLTINKNLRRRRAAEIRFKWMGLCAIGLAMIFLAILFISIFKNGIPGFFQHYVTLQVYLDEKRMDPEGNASINSLYNGDARGIINDAIFKVLDPQGRSDKREAKKIVSSGGEKRLRNLVLDDPRLLGQIIKVDFAVDDDIDSFLRGYIKRETPESDRRISDRMVSFVDKLANEKLIKYRISDYLFFGSAKAP